MNSFSISETIDETIDYLKQHYEYVLPFSLFYVILTIVLSLVEIDPKARLLIQLIVLPLSFSFQYYALKYNQTGLKSFKHFFEVYTCFFKYLGTKIVSGIIILILISPILFTMFQLVENYNFDTEKLMHDIQKQSIKLPANMSLTILISSLLVIFSLPFLLFIEYIAIIDNYGVFESLKLSYHIGSKYYAKIFGILVLSFIATFAGILTCGFGFIVILPFIYLLNYFTYKKLSKLMGIETIV